MPYPYFNSYQSPQPQPSMMRVAGEAEAYNYPMAPGVTMLFTDGMCIYVKTTDASPVGGFRFDVFVKREPVKPESSDYLTRAEFEAFKASLAAFKEVSDGSAK